METPHLGFSHLVGGAWRRSRRSGSTKRLCVRVDHRHDDPNPVLLHAEPALCEDVEGTLVVASNLRELALVLI